VGTLRQRIVGILGSNYNDKLVPVTETTDIVTINGFVIKPEFSKKTKGDQFFFVNNRFIRSPFLNHAVDSAFEGLLTKDSHPGYFVFMEVNPSDIDINIHPSKTEIKFTDERSIYQILRSSIKQALGKFNIAPSLDFDRDPSFDFPQPKDYTSLKIPSVNFNPDYNPFKENSGAKQEFQRPEKSERDTNNLQNWQKLYKNFDDFSSGKILPEKESPLNFSENVVKPRFFVIGTKYIVTYIRSGLVIIDQHRAHERILFEKLEKAYADKQTLTQNQLFPQTYEINSADFELLKEMIEELKMLGFDLDLFGKNTLVVRGVPAVSKSPDVKALLDEVLEQYKNNVKNLKLPKNISLLQSMASGMAIRSGQNLSDMEIDALIADLFACENPYHAPNGKPTMVNISTDELDAKFLKS
jgi:DNA mismatch repair protein MutL